MNSNFNPQRVNVPRDCLSCANSFSEEGEEFDNLFCMVKDKYVEEDDCCKEYN